MIDELADLLFGWVPDLLPFEISRAARMRRYRRGRRVFFRGRVSGLPTATRTTYLAAERGQLWAATRKGDAGLVSIPLPDDPAAVMYNDRVGLTQGGSVTFEVDRRRLEMIPNALDRELLRLAILEGIDRMSPRNSHAG